MSADWPRLRISDVANFLNNKRVPLKSLDRKKRQGQYPYYGASGIVDYIDDFIFDGNYLLISEDGENLRTRKTPVAFKAHGKFWVNNHAHVLSEKEEGILDYLEYYFSQLDLTPYITGAAQPKLNKANLDRIEIPIPPYQERLAINRVLNNFAQKIQLNHQINQTLEQMAQAIFKSWFVDFEPVRAKMEAKKRWHALQSGNESASTVCYPGEPQPLPDLETYMNLAAMQAISGKTSEQLARMEREQPDQYAQLRATAELFPSAMQSSELGEIPEGWEVSEIGKEVNVVGGGTPSTKNPEFWEGGNIHWTTPKDLSNLADKVLINTDRKITSKGLEKISSGLLPVDTVLMSSRAPVGYLALAKIPVAVNQGYIAMKCEKCLSPEYVIQWASANMDEIKRRASGTTFSEISKKNFKMIPVLVPDEKLIDRYSVYVKNIYSEIEAKVRESYELAKLRDTLLPKLLSGEITVPEAEAQLATTGEVQA